MHAIGRAARTALAVVAAEVILGVLIAQYAQKSFGATTKVRATLAVTLVIITVGFFAVRVRQHAPWFHPLIFPAIYLAFATLGPVAYIEATHRGLGLLTPDLITSTTTDVLALSILGVIAGIVFAFNPTARPKPRREQALVREVDWRAFRRYGRLLAVACVAQRLAYFAQHRNLAYGFNQFNVTSESQLNTIFSGLYLIAVLAVILGNLNLGQKRIVAWTDVAMLLGYAVLAALGGSRAILLTPLLAVVLIYHSALRKIRFRSIVVGVLVVLYLSQGISQYRHTGSVTRPKLTFASIAEDTFAPLESPAWITSKVTAQVPSVTTFHHGGTYVGAIVRLLPGLIADVLFGNPSSTGSFVFKNEILHDTNPNQGYSFAFPSESYLNFGLTGSFVMAFFLGLLLGWAWQHYPERAGRATDLFYPILVAALPYAWRSDFLTQVKVVLYPLIILWALFYACRPCDRVTTDRRDWKWSA